MNKKIIHSHEEAIIYKRGVDEYIIEYEGYGVIYKEAEGYLITKNIKNKAKLNEIIEDYIAIYNINKEHNRLIKDRYIKL